MQTFLHLSELSQSLLILHCPWLLAWLSFIYSRAFVLVLFYTVKWSSWLQWLTYKALQSLCIRICNSVFAIQHPRPTGQDSNVKYLEILKRKLCCHSKKHNSFSKETDYKTNILSAKKGKKKKKKKKFKSGKWIEPTKSRGSLKNGANEVLKLFIRPQQPLCKQWLWQKLIRSALFF